MNTSALLTTPGQSETHPELIDRSVILDRVGGDEELLREISAIFLEEYPTLIEEIRSAVGNQDATGLERAAHTLKGSVANFGAQAATQAAYRLEAMGRKGELSESRSAFDDLVIRFDQLHPILEQLAS
jgi:HPt (histidine-containing phosphotransfer) domain-containing protein